MWLPVCGCTLYWTALFLMFEFALMVLAAHLSFPVRGPVDATTRQPNAGDRYDSTFSIVTAWRSFRDKPTVVRIGYNILVQCHQRRRRAAHGAPMLAIPLP
jgi:hypothetical protein